MAYNNKNYLKKAAFIIAIYKSVKQDDIPDTHIVSHIFPKYGIVISYRTWCNIKSISGQELKEIKMPGMSLVNELRADRHSAYPNLFKN
jgi:hypothetical protein